MFINNIITHHDCIIILYFSYVSIACISFTPTVEPWYVELGMLRFWAFVGDEKIAEPWLVMEERTSAQWQSGLVLRSMHTHTLCMGIYALKWKWRECTNRMWKLTLQTPKSWHLKDFYSSNFDGTPSRSTHNQFATQSDAQQCLTWLF